MNLIEPSRVIEQVAAAVPPDCHKHIVIIGSLAAGYHFFAGRASLQVRTKDVDCVLSPRIAAVDAGRAVAERLLESGWHHRTGGEHTEAGTSETPDADLPAIRLYPPDSTDWFIELLTVPDSERQPGRGWTRVQLQDGHWGLPSFRFLSIAAFDAMATQFGIACARPEMLALANLLEHPLIKPERMSGLIVGRAIKRSNKDLGRVLAIAYLAGEAQIEFWAQALLRALKECFPTQWVALAAAASQGLRELLGSRSDLEEAWETCRSGLLVSRPPTLDQLRIVGERLIVEALEPLAEAATGESAESRDTGP